MRGPASARSGFEPGVEVADPLRLFGHSDPGGLLETMMTELALGSSFHLYGERRSGKSSLLRCLKNRIDATDPRYLVIYLNFRAHGSIKGAADAHRFLLAHIHAVAVGLGIAGDGEFRDLPRDARWEKTYSVLRGTPDFELPGALNAYIDDLSHSGHGVILLIDEYEHLLLKTYGGEAGAFFVIRTLSTKESIGGVKPLCFVIAGAEPWQEICEICGSPELNTATTGFNVGAISHDGFRRMWESCIERSSDQVRERVSASGVFLNDVYELAGGWPFYGKVIGHSLGTSDGGIASASQALEPHFEVVWRRLSQTERRALTCAEEGELLEGSAPVDLVRRSLVAKDGDGLAVPNGRLWARFVRERRDEDRNSVEEARTKVSDSLDRLQRVLYADDALRVASAGLLSKLRQWAISCNRESDLRRAARIADSAHGRELEAVKEMAVAMRIGSGTEDSGGAYGAK